MNASHPDPSAPQPRRRKARRPRRKVGPPIRTEPSEREELFCRAYAAQYPKHNASAAARAAGYLDDKKTAQRLMERPRVKKRIAELVRDVTRKALAKSRKIELSARNLLEEDAARALTHITDVMALQNGEIQVFNSDDWPAHARAAVKSVEVGLYGAKITLHDKDASLNRLYRYLGLDAGDPNRQKPGGSGDEAIRYYLPEKQPLVLPGTAVHVTPDGAAVPSLNLPPKQHSNGHAPTNGHAAPPTNGYTDAADDELA